TSTTLKDCLRVAEWAITPMHSWEDFACGRNLGGGAIPPLPRAVVPRDAERSNTTHVYKILDPRSHPRRCLSVFDAGGSRGRDPSVGRHTVPDAVALPIDPASRPLVWGLVRDAHMARGPWDHSDLYVRHRLAR